MRRVHEKFVEHLSRQSKVCRDNDPKESTEHLPRQQKIGRDNDSSENKKSKKSS